MNEEEKKQIKFLKKWLNEHILIKEDSRMRFNYEDCKNLLNLIEKQNKKIENAIKYIEDDKNYFEDGENWENVLKIKDILEGTNE